MSTENDPDFRINPDSYPNVCRIAPKILSPSVTSPSVVKIGQWLRTANKSPKIRYSAVVREVEKLCKIQITTKSYQVLSTSGPSHNSKFQWNRLITFAVILLTEWQTEWQTNRQTNKHHRSHILLGGGITHNDTLTHCIEVLTYVDPLTCCPLLSTECVVVKHARENFDNFWQMKELFIYALWEA